MIKLNNKYIAFTMAEAILVMTILGVIAAIVISTLTSGNYKQKALITQGKKILDEIDDVTEQIKIKNSPRGIFNSLFIAGTTTEFDPTSNLDALGDLYKGYFAISRKKCDTDSCPCKATHSVNCFYLKSGGCVGIGRGGISGTCNCTIKYSDGRSNIHYETCDSAWVNRCCQFNTTTGSCERPNGATACHYTGTGGYNTFCSVKTSTMASLYPGETAMKTTSGSFKLFFDVNGEKGPNSEGIDQFYVTFNQNGLVY